jgi:hypothetical protein
MMASLPVSGQITGVRAARMLDVPDRGRVADGTLAAVIAVRGKPLDGVRTLEDVVDMKSGMGGRRPDC